MRKGATLLNLTALACAGLLGLAEAQDAPPRAGEPVLVEMFLSQSCGSCPPAAEFLADLAQRDDIVAIGWHIDYWNSLNTKRGRWSDPFSDPAYTDRQRDYNRQIRRRSSVYTPQVIVNGVSETIGSEREQVEDMIETVRASYKQIKIKSYRTPDQVFFDIGDTLLDGEMYLITFTPITETHVPRGENADMVFSDVNIVTDMMLIGAVADRPERVSAPAPEEGTDCALIIQQPNHGRILAAAYCADE